MRLLFATTRGAGHVLPLVPFARACERAGHQVLVAGPPGAAPLARRAGLRFRTLGEPSQEAVARFRTGQRGLSPMEAMARALPELFVRLYGAAALPGMLDAIEQWRPDVVVRETGEFSSLVAAERLGVPLAQVGIGLSTQVAAQLLPLAASGLDDLRATVGLGPNPDAGSGGELLLTLAPRSLDGPRARGVRRFRHPPGHARDAAPGLFGDRDEPLVYVSFGTEVPSPARSYFPDLYRSVLAALAGLPIRILMTVGDERDPRELEPLPPLARVERWVPQAAAMHAATAMVGHGGSGSTLSALAAGIPMAVVPLFADQPLNAGRVAETGAGIALDTGPPSPSSLRSAVRALLGDSRYRARARDVADEIAALPPIDDAVGALSALAARPGSAALDAGDAGAPSPRAPRAPAKPPRSALGWQSG
jgi:UDP:flavonoid glycosyltransferase YjiC (YdhE family)